MISINYNTVFVDFLDLTYSPLDNPYLEIKRFLLDSGFVTSSNSFDTSKSTHFFSPVTGVNGDFKITFNSSWIKYSSSGETIRYLKSQGAWEEFLMILSSSAHKVTRLDVSMDVNRDFPLIYNSLKRAYPDSMVKVGRKVTKSRWLLGPRLDGKDSGTYYVGNKRDQTQLKVYDKTKQMLDSFNVEIVPCTSRYEIKVLRNQATLRDASNPTSLFWHYAGVLKLKKPKDVIPWESGSIFTGWEYKKNSRTKFETLERIVENSGCLVDLAFLCSELGDSGRSILLRMIEKKIDGELVGFSSPKLVEDQKGAVDSYIRMVTE